MWWFLCRFDPLSDSVEVSHSSMLIILWEVLSDSLWGDDRPSMILVVADSLQPCSLGGIARSCMEVPNVGRDAALGRVDSSHGAVVDVRRVGVGGIHSDC